MISGCGNYNKQSQLLILQKKVSSCLAQNNDSNDCKVAKEKYHLLRTAALNLQENPQKFGINVLHLQTKLINLKSGNASKADLETIRKKIARYTSLIAFFESPN